MPAIDPKAKHKQCIFICPLQQLLFVRRRPYSAQSECPNRLASENAAAIASSDCCNYATQGNSNASNLKSSAPHAPTSRNTKKHNPFLRTLSTQGCAVSKKPFELASAQSA